jgi:ribonuclease HIII
LNGLDPAIETGRPIIGIDESGKGDFFGPLVIAGVLLEKRLLSDFEKLGVRDSKKLSDRKVLRLASDIRQLSIWNVVAIGPEKYNELYSKIKNLNRLLGWGHARVIENILAEKAAAVAISDKFGNDRFILDSLQKEGKKIELRQVVRGENHPAVAAASIIARAEFIKRLDKMSREYNIIFPKGASTLVDDTGRRLIGETGKDILVKVAKLHFKNYRKILN